jgi:HEPN domain-containing protein
MVSLSMSAPPNEPTPAQRWFALAEEDLAAAQILIADGSAALRIAGFLAQQAAEKALKAGLFANSIAAPRIHGLNQLLARYPHAGAPSIDADDLDVLDPWVIDGRYAADLPDLGRVEADELLITARRVVEAVRNAEPSVKRDV